MIINHDLNRHLDDVLRHIDVGAGTLSGEAGSVKRVSDLRGCFADATTYEHCLHSGDDVVYRVASFDGYSGPGDLSYGLGVLLPGRIGDEFFLTRGHYHAWRDAAEVYVGLSGSGGLLLKDGRGERFVPFNEGAVVYVPGGTAHRTVNVGPVPLAYLGIYPARAGHDYAGLARDDFGLVVVSAPTGYQVLPRADYLRRIQGESPESETQ